MTTQHTFRIEKDSLKKLTVFNDRAELKREFTVTLEPGLNEVLFENVTNSIHDDTVRVTGSGDALIEEVKTTSRRTVTGEADNARAKVLRDKSKELEGKIRTKENEESSLNKRVGALDKMIYQIGSGIAAPKHAKFTADGETLESITTFFAFYDEQSIQLRADLHAHKEEKQKLMEEKNAVDNELFKIDNGEYIRVISVLLNSNKGGPVNLELTYQVWGAQWYPFYDVRVETKSEGTEIQLAYFANITQSTNEDWEVDSLILSTAQPSMGGNVPELGTLDVKLYVPPPPPPPVQAYGYGAPMAKTCRMERMAVCNDAMEFAAGAAPLMANREAAVSTQTLSSEFAIERPCSIPADGQQHKVTIGTVTLRPKLVHESVPSKNPAVFLTASSLNDSPLPILNGDASVFLDGAFIARTNIKQASPGERLSISLGSDPSVKVEYKPVHKYHEQKGVVNKLSSVMHEQKIVVRNTRKDAILLTIREHVPRSTDDKIKVTLVSPSDVVTVSEEDAVKETDSAPTPGAKLLPNKNLEWTVAMESGTAQNLLVKYSIEHPACEKIEFNERYN